MRLYQCVEISQLEAGGRLLLIRLLSLASFGAWIDDRSASVRGVVRVKRLNGGHWIAFDAGINEAT
jgi:hypothetical protein